MTHVSQLRVTVTLETERGSPEALDRSRRSLWEPWLALGFFAFVTNFVWEMLQAPLYIGMTQLPWWRGTAICAFATVGDVVIALVAYAGATAGRERWWLRRPSIRRVTLYLAVGLVVTLVLEVVNVYVMHRWSYASAMPLVLGIGVSPIAQWLIVPIVTLVLARCHVERAGPHSLLKGQLDGDGGW